VSHWRHQMENGYNLWTSHGRQVEHKRYDKLHQLLWRPRPPSLLPDAKEKEIRKNLRDYSRKYEAEVSCRGGRWLAWGSEHEVGRGGMPAQLRRQRSACHTQVDDDTQGATTKRRLLTSPPPRPFSFSQDAKLMTMLKGGELKARQEKQRAFEEFLRSKSEEYNAARQVRAWPRKRPPNSASLHLATLPIPAAAHGFARTHPFP
jgi:hypothetical protein